MRGKNDLLIPLEDANVTRLLELWAWLLPRDVRPIALTLFGDVLVEDPRGAVHLLDITEGELRLLAPSRRELEVQLEQPERRREWLLLDLVELLKGRGTTLRKGQCFGWRVPPLVGAPLTTENIDVFDIDRYQVIASTVLAALKAVPPGTVVDGFTVDGEAP